MTYSVTPPHLTAEQVADLERRWNSHPGMLHMGARVDLSEVGTVRASIDPILTHHRGGLGTDAVNGAVISGMFDLVTGLSGYLHALGHRVGVAQLNVQFLRPVEGHRLEVVGRPVKVGRNLIFTAAELFDQEGRVCARCDGIVAVAGGAHLPSEHNVSL